MSTTQIGRDAENLVAYELKSQGFKVVEQNWRTRWCEIDIVATKSKVVYFIEVKYRKNSNWGDGLEAITLKKIQQMSFAAELWVHDHKWNGDYCLLAASVSGTPLKLGSIVEI